MKKLNLGCGSNKLEGFINIDAEKSCKPDLIWDFATKSLPYRSNSIDEIVLFHCIEHIKKSLHYPLILEFWRLLKPKGRLLISYPEFIKCVNNWKRNYKGLRDFWEATLYGRQLYPHDAHVCIMNTPDFIELLRSVGFNEIVAKPELNEPYNTVISCCKDLRNPTYVDQVSEMMKSCKVKIKKAS